MRPISWLHISDIHLRASDEWSQDVVLNAMCRNIEKQRAEGITADFILVTGDIAFSGKPEEYELAADFFDDLQCTSGVPKERIFCVPGNHDINRDRQNLCFQGGRSTLRGPSQVDALLAGGEDLETLLKRQENYRDFQQTYFAGQERTYTVDGLGYISRLEINEIQLAIIGLNSAWLAEGGMDDHGKLLIGERQAIAAVKLVQGRETPPNIVVGMAHHPLHLLQEFDRQAVQNRVGEVCHFFHCGHLHVPEAHVTGPEGSGYLTLVAGASFETRQAPNAFYIVKLDLLNGRRHIESFRYNPTNITFSHASSNLFPIEMSAPRVCDLGELAKAMQSYCSALEPWSYYLSALILRQKTEIPIPSQNTHIFGSFDILLTLSDSDLKHKTDKFMTFRNVLHVLYTREPLSEILVRHGDSIRKYSEALTVACENDSALRQRLDAYERDSRLLADREPQQTFSHTLGLLTEFARAGEWDNLREHAERLLGFGDLKVANQAKRMLTLVLANSDDPTDKKKAIKHYQSLVEAETADFVDIGNLAQLLMEIECMDEASKVILNGIKVFPDKKSYFSEIGQKIVGVTGNKDLRRQIETATRG